MTSVEIEEIARLREDNSTMTRPWTADLFRDVKERRALETQLPTMAAELDEWQRRTSVAQDAQIGRDDVIADAPPEAQYIKGCENGYPTCGGSGQMDGATAALNRPLAQATANERKERILEAAVNGVPKISINGSQHIAIGTVFGRPSTTTSDFSWPMGLSQVPYQKKMTDVCAINDAPPR